MNIAKDFLSHRIITLKIKLMHLVEKSAHLVHTDLVFTRKVKKNGVFRVVSKFEVEGRNTKVEGGSSL